MNETPYLSEPGPSSEMPDWLTALAIAIAIAILLGVFIWIVIQLEPVMSDFIATDAPVATSTPED